MKNLLALFNQMKNTRQSLGVGNYVLVSVIENMFVADCSTKNACLVFLLSDDPRESCVEFGGMQLKFFRQASVSLRGVKSTQSIAVLECTDRLKQHIFITMGERTSTLLAEDGRSLHSSRQISDYVDDWREMFTRRFQLSMEERIGLWGELAILNMLPQPIKALEAWHGPLGAIFDFARNGVNLEVKTSLSEPIHYFSMEQLTTEVSSTILIASVILCNDMNHGYTLSEMISKVRIRMRNASLFDRKLLRLRIDLCDDSPERYSLGGVSYFRAEGIAKPAGIPAGVSHVRFCSNLLFSRPIRNSSFQSILSRMFK